MILALITLALVALAIFDTVTRNRAHETIIDYIQTNYID